MLIRQFTSDFNREPLLYATYMQTIFTGPNSNLFSLLAERVQSFALNSTGNGDALI